MENIFAHPFFVNIILPFIFTFVLFYALMQKINLLGNAQAHLLIALALSFFFIGVPALLNITHMIVPVVAFLVVIAFCLMLLYGILGIEFYVPGKKHALKAWIAVILTILGIIVIVSLTGITKKINIPPEYIPVFAFIVLTGIVVWIMVQFGSKVSKE